MWFAGTHKNDFVFTVGGYHPQFPINNYPHYPRVDRVGLNWKISSEVAITGTAYMALTSSGIMAGGELSLVYELVKLKAWLIAMCDFWIQWKPWHYEADIGVSIGASYTLKIFKFQHTFKVELGASLQIAGPSFHGKAHVSWHIISFTISFGKDEAPDQSVDWNSVEEFLVSSSTNQTANAGLANDLNIHGLGLNEKINDFADSNKVCSISLIGVSNASATVRGDQVSLEVISQVPVSEVTYNNEGLQLKDNETDLHCLPFGENTKLSSQMNVKLSRIDDGKTELIEVQVTKLTEAVPAALWGAKHAGEPSADSIQNALKGLKLDSVVVESDLQLPVTGDYDAEKLDEENTNISESIINDSKTLKFGFDDSFNNNQIQDSSKAAFEKFIQANNNLLSDFGILKDELNSIDMNGYHCDIHSGSLGLG
jgi:hypothetical protein